ncbi:leukocyte immunoglobulin-like receptor subfamily B member 3-like protein, partial [Cricetulus griseus]
IFDNKPCLSVLPRPVVTSGENVTLKCFSQEEYDRFIVTKEGEQMHPMIMESQKTSAGQFQALFSLGPVTPRSSGTFKCYGYYKANPYVWSEPSDHLEIQVSGLSRKPTMLTQQNHVLASVETLIIHSCSDTDYDRLVLAKKGGNYLSQRHSVHSQAGLSQANFTLGPVSSFHKCQYRY